MMETLWQDLRYGIRMLLKNPGFTATAVLILALGIGANTTVFSVINAILLRPLPVAEPERLVWLFSTESNNPDDYGTCSYRDYLDFQTQDKIFSGLIAYKPVPLSLSSDSQSERISGTIASGNYFSVLGVRPALGRTFLPEEDQTPLTHPVVVVSYSFWQRHFGGDPNLVGKTLTLNGHSFTVVGIATEGFPGTDVVVATDVWVPMMMQAWIRPGPDRLTDRGNRWLHVMGRLKPGVTLEQAQVDAQAFARQLVQAHPETNRGMSARLDPANEAHPEGRRMGFPRVAGLLMVVVTLVLLIACANIASLLLVRASARHREIAIRLALGAGRARLVRQLLTESMLLSFLGGGAGLLLALWTADLLPVLQPPSPNAVALDLSLDTRVLGFTILASLLTGVLFGLAPALQASKPDLAPALKDDLGASKGISSRSRLRSLLVISQVALSLVLLISAGLFLRSLQNASTIDPGFETKNGLIVPLNLEIQGYTVGQAKEFYRQTVERLEALSGAQSVSLASSVPLGSSFSATTITIEGREPLIDGRPIFAGVNVVGPHYFQTLGIPLLRGREFSVEDGEDDPGVVIINETMARRFWPGEDAIGKRISFIGPQGPYAKVIGVAKDGKYRRLGESPQPYMYLPFYQSFHQLHHANMTLHIRTDGDPVKMMLAVQSEVLAVDKNLPVPEIKSLTEHMGQPLWAARMGASLFGIFGFLALLLAAVGIYGVMAYSVTRRTQEIGIRMALGAQPLDILKLVVRQGMTLVLIGVAIGLAGAWVVMRVLSSFFYGVSPTDLVTYTGVAVLLTGVALLASFIPARRATKVDPMVALRYE